MSETIELIQWHCRGCTQFGGGVYLEPAQAHADGTGHLVQAELTKTVREQIVIGPDGFRGTVSAT
jgi:hypothetical protein